MAALDLQVVHDQLVSIALEAGRIMLSAESSRAASATKKNSTDLVTETDKAVEKYVSTKLHSIFPTFKFIGEETFSPGQNLTDEPTFIVDPIDGTTNFIHNFPFFCISLGLAVEKVPVIGVIYNPTLEHLYTAFQGNGAYLQIGNNAKRRLPLREAEPLNDLSTCLVAAEWGSDRSGAKFELTSDVFKKLVSAKEDGGSMIHSMRSIGSAALSLASVAAGQNDVYWSEGCWAWDVCAGWCILTESGGIMVGLNSGEWECEIEGRMYLAVRGAPSGQKAIIQQLWRVKREVEEKLE
ncbi:BgTH12-04668 [Blumeria graminis f. sp. triticale]|uniref:Inositol-1-monophosphatase n=3 Tax=Blumeria graminis TaxID=34373 RepID=A0A381LFZ9_BLUGR|nr:Inositol monophosphatase [Blumeria graminis f. sp. tritici 96224]CAD6499014.1 BgTH12-04668 [Blumeria graminis f. sp. triticale]VCU39147.1 Bgt-1364 [Blumeria graminis f. sp. tritici]